MSTTGSFSGPIIELGKAIVKRAAEQQGGLLDGDDPTEFRTSSPIRLWAIQLGIIIITAQLLALALAKLRQPKVIAEVIGGIVLGPTLFGRIPGFTEHIFPAVSRPYLSLTAEIGLVLFLFLVGLEIDTTIIKRNARSSLIISAGGITIPFGLGAAVAIPIYKQFVDPSTDFSHFLLFVGVAYSITAFPVLCRILTELKLLDDVIGIIVLSAGVGNDIVGWILLALTVALVNASSGLTALYILLVSVAWVLFILYPCRWFFTWFARWTGSTEKGPTPIFMTATILLVFASAFMTDAIGVNAIFGGFLAGLAIPRDGNLNITITEKLEDMVAIIFLPLYFTISGLSTNLGLLNTGLIWGYTIMILVVAYIGKFFGGSIAARFAGFGWRESFTIGTLMSCKGLIELIVLNVGLQAGILDTRVFSMFVLEAVVLTFACTPVAVWLYPPHLRTRAAATGANFANLSGGQGEKGALRLSSERKERFLVVLDRMGHMPSAMAITQLLRPAKELPAPTKTPSIGHSTHPPSPRRSREPATDNKKTTVTALRLVELTDRTSDLMRSSVPEELMVRDPLLNVFHMFAGLNDMEVDNRLAVATYDTYHERVGFVAEESSSQLILLSWASPLRGLVGGQHGGVPLTIHPTTISGESHGAPPQATHTSNPLAGLFAGPSSPGATGGAPHSTTLTRHEKLTSVAHSHFIRRLYASAPADVGLFVDNQAVQQQGHILGSKAHLLIPFFGGPDDRLALEFVVQLCERPEVTATIIRVTKEALMSDSEGENRAKLELPEQAHLSGTAGEHGLPITDTLHSIPRMADTIYPNVTTQTRLASDTADNICWFKYAPQEDPDAIAPQHTPQVQDALTRVTFTSLSSPKPLHSLVDKASEVAAERRLIVVVGRGKRLAAESHHDEMKILLDEEEGRKHGGLGNEMRNTLGDVATAFMVSRVSAGLLVMQASATSTSMEA
ncbi:K(+)/H(+) antiporter [Tulasnella sp. 424]|nr:K(+)/H(+) antiporter [Tulasnella sp. 424]KAG8977238.1 K(+)/H(+) antiporter [Tulasnella sp. 425]